MEQIKFKKQPNIRESGLQVRVAADLNERLVHLSNETGMTKQCIVDILLRKALDAVVVIEGEK